jgi:hypothetical protein
LISVRSACLLDSATPSGVPVTASDLLWSRDGYSATAGLIDGPAYSREGRTCVDALDRLIVGTQSPVCRVIAGHDAVPPPSTIVKLSVVEVKDRIFATGQGYEQEKE